jgi:hypothetical protein
VTCAQPSAQEGSNAVISNCLSCCSSTHRCYGTGAKLNPSGTPHPQLAESLRWVSFKDGRHKCTAHGSAASWASHKTCKCALNWASASPHMTHSSSHDAPERVRVAQRRKLAEQQPAHKELHFTGCRTRAQLFIDDAAQICNR